MFQRQQSKKTLVKKDVALIVKSSLFPRCVSLSSDGPIFHKFLEDFFFIHANDMGEEEHPRGAPSPFSMTHLGPSGGPAWAIPPTSVRRATGTSGLPIRISPPIFPHFESAHARSRQPQNHPGHPSLHLHHAADTGNHEVPNFIFLNLDVRRPTMTEAQPPESRERWKFSVTEMKGRTSDPPGFPQKMLKLREANVLMFLKAKTSAESEIPMKRGTA